MVNMFFNKGDEFAKIDLLNPDNEEEKIKFLGKVHYARHGNADVILLGFERSRNGAKKVDWLFPKDLEQYIQIKEGEK